MSIEPGLHGVPSITLAASFAEKRYWGSFGLQNREHGWPETGMRNSKENIYTEYNWRIASEYMNDNNVRKRWEKTTTTFLTLFFKK